MSDDVPSFTLQWEGPIEPAAGRLAPAELERLERPGVYACVYDYPAAAMARVYVGVTANFRQRFRSHVAATLGLTYWLADDTGGYAYEPQSDHLFATVEELVCAHRLAVEEVGRMRWYCALDDSDPHIPWPMFEGLLIRHVKTLAADETACMVAGRRIASCNDRGGMLPEAPVVLRNRGADEIVGILGDVVAWPLAEQAA